MILSTQQMREAEKAAFDAGISEEGLMESAGANVADVIARYEGKARRCLIFIGKGHNGGDGLVIARVLGDRGWHVAVLLPFHDDELAPLTRRQLDRLPPEVLIEREEHIPFHPDVVVDALLGIGISGDLRGPAAKAAASIHEWRSLGAHVYAVDLPSGLDSDTGKAGKGAVIADVTITIGFPKAGLLADHAANFVGRLEVVPLSGAIAPEPPAQPGFVTTAAMLRERLPLRRYDSHKGTYGRLGIIAGSDDFPGAARIAAAAAVRGGAGLITLFVPPSIRDVIASSTVPEVMTVACEDYREILSRKFDALAIGPGVGFSRRNEVLDVIRDFTGPAVVDADAVRMVTESGRSFAGPRLFTPHPGEMAALLPQAGRTRAQWAAESAKMLNATILLKGARTVIASGDRLAFNATGGPGMASGGMGDTLTGVCGALLAQGLDPFDAAITGAWLCGRAGDMAVFSCEESEQSLTAGDVIAYLGRAFLDLRRAG